MAQEVPQFGLDWATQTGEPSQRGWRIYKGSAREKTWEDVTDQFTGKDLIIADKTRGWAVLRVVTRTDPNTGETKPLFDKLEIGEKRNIFILPWFEQDDVIHVGLVREVRQVPKDEDGRQSANQAFWQVPMGLSMSLKKVSLVRPMSKELAES